MKTDTLVSRLRAAGHDERLSTGALYLEAADALEALSEMLPIMECDACGNHQRAKDGVACGKCGDMYKWSGPVSERTFNVAPYPDLDTAKRDFTFGQLWVLGSQYADLLNAAPQALQIIKAAAKLLQSASGDAPIAPNEVIVLSSEYHQLFKDAKRYEWLRDNMRRMPMDDKGTRHFFDQSDALSFQEAVDEAMSRYVVEKK